MLIKMSITIGDGILDGMKKVFPGIAMFPLQMHLNGIVNIKFIPLKIAILLAGGSILIWKLKIMVLMKMFLLLSNLEVNSMIIMYVNQSMKLPEYGKVHLDKNFIFLQITIFLFLLLQKATRKIVFGMMKQLRHRLSSELS